MVKILLIKTSSMGDILHTLPAVTDASLAQPVIIDWVVEESFQEIPCWHKAVRQVIPIALRRWRNKRPPVCEISNFLHMLRMEHYDYIIDAQGLIKSAVIACLAHGKTYGYHWQAAREPWATILYRKRFKIPKQHAVTKIRQLFAAVLNYPVPDTFPKYGIDKSSIPKYAVPVNSFLLLHGTSRVDKCWQEAKWLALAKLLNNVGYTVVLPWGNDLELARAQRLATGCNAIVLPKLNLNELAGVISNVLGVVTVDTGLGHLAAALDIPTVALYGNTLPELVGTYGHQQVHLCDFWQVSPQEVFHKILSIIK